MTSTSDPTRAAWIAIVVVATAALFVAAGVALARWRKRQMEREAAAKAFLWT